MTVSEHASPALTSGDSFLHTTPLDEKTVEIKRVWTHPDHRGQGLARLVLTELEAEAARRGFSEVFLSTGPRQPEAVHLYFTAGYEPQFDPTLDPMTIGAPVFRKHLHAA